MTQCDSYTHEADAENLEEDEDVGPILDNSEEYQQLKQELMQAQEISIDEELEAPRSQETGESIALSRLRD